MREKSKACIPIERILTETTGRGKWKRKMLQFRLWNEWSRIVGEALAQQTAPARWQHHTLVVHASSTAWVQELSFMKENLIERIRASIPKLSIDGLRFEVNVNLETERIHHSNRPSTSLSEEEKEFIERAAEQVNDTELRDAIRRAMSKGLSRRHHFS